MSFDTVEILQSSFQMFMLAAVQMSLCPLLFYPENFMWNFLFSGCCCYRNGIKINVAQMQEEELEVIEEAKNSLRNLTVHLYEIDFTKPNDLEMSDKDLKTAEKEQNPIIILNPAINYSNEGFFDGVL